MATLQKIRNQGGILVSIFIGVALVAFIVGDALSSGSSIINRSRNKVGEIAGESIDIQDYQMELSRNEEMIKMTQQVPSDENTHRQIQDETWNSIVNRIVLDREFKALGMGLSADELFDVLLGQNMTPTLRQLFTDPNTGQVNNEQAKQVIQRIMQYPDNHPEKQYWLYLEERIAEMQRMNKYTTLLLKSMYIPEAQAKASTEDVSVSVDISFLMKSYSSINDSTISVSDSEIKAYYDSHKQLFKQEERRQLAYVNFDISASAQDITETEEAVSKLIPEYAEASNIMEFARLSSDKPVNPVFYKKGELGEEGLDEFLFEEKSDAVFGPYLKDNAYNIARVAERRFIPDSVKARHILIRPVANTVEAVEQAEKLADSLLNVLRQGGNFDQMARLYSADQNSAINGGDLGWFTEGAMVQPFSDTAFFAKKNEIKLAKTQFGIHLIQVTDQSKPVEKVMLGIVAKEIVPSQQTINQIYNDARVFANNLNTIADFEAALTEHNQTKRYATVSKNDHTIAGIGNARELIRQAYLSDAAGKVLTTNRQSPIFESNNTYTVAILTGIQEEGIAPIKNVTQQIRSELIRKKKGEILANELKNAISGSESLLSIAQKTNTEVLNASDINFNSFQIAGAGIEPNLISTMVRLPEGQISQPIIGNQGVYVAVVTSKSETPVSQEEIADTKRSMEQMNMYKIIYQGIPALTKDAGVTDLRYKFY